jgi:hypothetical protein
LETYRPATPLLPQELLHWKLKNTPFTTANTTLTAQVVSLSGGTAAGGAAGGGIGTAPGIAVGGAGAASLVTFAATPVMVNHQDLINYSTKVGTTISNKGCDKLITEFDMKSSGTIVYTTKLQAKCVKMGWHIGTQQIINFTNTAGSTISTSADRSTRPRFRPSARSFARALEPCSMQEQGKTTQ